MYKSWEEKLLDTLRLCCSNNFVQIRKGTELYKVNRKNNFFVRRGETWETCESPLM